MPSFLEETRGKIKIYIPFFSPSSPPNKIPNLTFLDVKLDTNLIAIILKLYCGKTGIRTLGTRKGTTVFETVPFDHSGIFPILWPENPPQKY